MLLAYKLESLFVFDVKWMCGVYFFPLNCSSQLLDHVCCHGGLRACKVHVVSCPLAVQEWLQSSSAVFVERSEEARSCVVMSTLMFWFRGPRAFDDTVNEKSWGPAQRGEVQTSHIKHTLLASRPPTFSILAHCSDKNHISLERFPFPWAAGGFQEAPPQLQVCRISVSWQKNKD